MRGKYICKEVFLRLSACVCLCHYVLIIVSLWCCRWAYNIMMKIKYIKENTSQKIIVIITHTHTHTHIYIYCHPQADCFVVSQLFSMARHVGHLKLGSKPAQLYVRLSIRPLGQQAYHVGKGIIWYYVATAAAAAAFVCLHFITYRIPEYSIHLKSFALCKRQPKIPSPECSPPMEERIYCNPLTDCFVVSQLFRVARHLGPRLYIYIYIYIYIYWEAQWLECSSMVQKIGLLSQVE